MRASDLIEQLENLIEEHGDRYVVYPIEDTSSGIFERVSVEKIEVEPNHETKYFCIS
jgi:hypothetical protein